MQAVVVTVETIVRIDHERYCAKKCQHNRPSWLEGRFCSLFGNELLTIDATGDIVRCSECVQATKAAL